MHPYRTHRCNALRAADIGTVARLSGWVHRVRDHGGLVFVDLRDHYGITQCVMEPGEPDVAEFERLRPETVVSIDGKVVARPPETINPERETGEVELRVTGFTVLSATQELPMPVFGDAEYPEEIRLRYRYLDLRRERMHANMVLRARVISQIRREMEALDFHEFQTPILTASSPEGARDFVVPSRLHPGKFYALPQAPQVFKQLLMVAGFDRYFQIAPCFRDEDPRADRAPGEFYQLDLEMAFATQDNVFHVAETVFTAVLARFAPQLVVTPAPFPRITYADTMLRYGSDKPDLRIPFEIADVTDVFASERVEFRAFKGVIAKGGVVRAIPAPGAAERPRSFFDKLNDWARSEKRAPGLGYLILVDDGGLAAKGPIARFIPPDLLAELCAWTGVKPGDALFFAAGEPAKAADLAGAARRLIAQQLDLIEKDSLRFCWIVDFPMYELDEATGTVGFGHNPFSMPLGGLEALEHTPPLEILAYQYDLVGNGYELASGAIRNNTAEGLIKAFELAGYRPEQVEHDFASLINAFRYGAPPHGGLAAGIERTIMVLAGEENLREVTPFPKTQSAEDLMMNAPTALDPKQLRDVHIRLALSDAKAAAEGSGS